MRILPGGAILFETSLIMGNLKLIPEVLLSIGYVTMMMMIPYRLKLTLGGKKVLNERKRDIRKYDSSDEWMIRPCSLEFGRRRPFF